MPRTVLLNPGPVNITDKVRQAMALPDLCHREKEFVDLMAAIRNKLLQAFNIKKEFTSVLVSGSGTAALEMAVSSSLAPGRSMLVIENGTNANMHTTKAVRMLLILMSLPRRSRIRTPRERSLYLRGEPSLSVAQKGRAWVNRLGPADISNNAAVHPQNDGTAVLERSSKCNGFPPKSNQ